MVNIVQMLTSELVISSVILVAVVVLLVQKAIKRYRFVHAINQLPGPPTYPVLGNVLEVMVPRNG